MFGIDYCFYCQEETDNFLCDKCKKSLVSVKKYYLLDDIPVYSCFYYNNIIKKMLIELKYKGNFIIAKFIAEEILKIIPIKNPTLVPIPISKKRLSDRGYNQSVLICKYIKDLMDCDIEYFALKKISESTQKNKTFIERQNSSFSGDVYCNKKNLIIIDDLVASGSTIKNAAQSLWEHNNINHKIIAITFAQTF